MKRITKYIFQVVVLFFLFSMAWGIPLNHPDGYFMSQGAPVSPPDTITGDKPLYPLPTTPPGQTLNPQST
ncbi:MAG: hypothetical protein PHX54_14480, partial [Lentimicrobiaceae bacterium]|nr:hypothetical protein [Lentimicrobiaceae bacterium]